MESWSHTRTVGWQCKQIEILQVNTQTVWAKVESRSSKPIQIGVYYCPPSDRTPDTVDDLNTVMENLDPDCPTILGSDYNVGDIIWESNTVTPNSDRKPLCERLIEILESRHLEQIQREPTREQAVLHYNDVIMGMIAPQITSLPECLLSHLMRCRSKKTSKLCVTGLYAGNSPVTGEFPTQMATSAENVSISWHHHVDLYCTNHARAWSSLYGTWHFGPQYDNSGFQYQSSTAQETKAQNQAMVQGGMGSSKRGIQQVLGWLP